MVTSLQTAGFIICLTLAAGTPRADTVSPRIDYQTRFQPTVGRAGMVVAAEPLAAEAGLAMLERGGNAVDAAVATGFALAVTLPRAGNLGGGGFMLLHDKETNQQTFIDYRESAPASATRDMYLKADGTVDKALTYFSHKAAGVPGTVAGLIHALNRYGTLDLKTVVAPAIALAEEGFAVSPALHASLSARADRLARNPEANRVYLGGDGVAPAIGDTLRLPDLAMTLKRIAEQGREGFYGGETARLIAEDMSANGGLITLDDLARYQPIEREPVHGTFRGYTVVSSPPPSSGGVHILQMLNLLEPLPMADYGHNSASYLHHLIEVMKLAYADRSLHLGDPDYNWVPTAELIDKEYATERRKLIDRNRATPSVDIAPGNILPPEGTQTTHYSVVDAAGNVVSNTYTINFSFGNGIVVPGTGMLLNNEMDDFAARPGFANAYGLIQGEKNAVAPNRRPLSSMTPTIVFKNDEPWLVTGSPGGSVIITTVLQTILNATVFDMNVAEALAVPRVHHQWEPDKTRIERGISADTQSVLESMGHTLEPSPWNLGRATAIMREGGWLYGFADMRTPGGHVATR
ncbi:gamma-glutamyltransferase [Luminiphilus syltensis NOR5-1B]|uniref:Glutathione hydrolase proenzyme n=1 Tax=Luminiphilus syltensis NOR5-1B TaxID=565045 RepID=B8KW46_9GAMM|nr:gamma-glutamyltransferase [Luminiphilus syltensis]EED36648.1 gamma-glutamyltransferase [Luminiphilus syltensis NOR5-1B]